MESVPDFRGAGWRGLEAEGTARHELPPERAEPTSGPETWNWSPASFALGAAIGERKLGGPLGPLGEDSSSAAAAWSDREPFPTTHVRGR